MNTGQLSKKFWKLARVPKGVRKLMIGDFDKEIAENHRKGKEEAKARRQARFDEKKAYADKKSIQLLEEEREKQEILSR